MGAFWGKVAKEMSPGEMGQASPGRNPDGPSPHSLLHLAQLHTDDQLGLGRHVLKHISLEPPQHVRSQQVMQLLNLIFFGDVSKLLQEALQVATRKSQNEGQKQDREAGQHPLQRKSGSG